MDQLLGIPYSSSENNARLLETLKMAYVAMSRPKYLLCIAIKKERIQSILNDKNKKRVTRKNVENRAGMKAEALSSL